MKWCEGFSQLDVWKPIRSSEIHDRLCGKNPDTVNGSAYFLIPPVKIRNTMNHGETMTRHTILLVLAITGIFILAAGCSTPSLPQSGSAIPAVPAVNVSIQPDITRYTLAMSSAPGIGLTPNITGLTGGSGKYVYLWKTDYGSFLSWNAPDFTVKELGSNITLPGGKVYWTYGSAPAGTTRPLVHVTLDVIDATTGSVVGHAERVIGWVEGDMAEIR
jgi:hypothetical protein